MPIMYKAKPVHVNKKGLPTGMNSKSENCTIFFFPNHNIHTPAPSPAFYGKKETKNI